MDKLQSLRIALRSLRRTPAFTAVAVATLALGIGATTAMFTVVNSVLLQPLPYANADRIVALVSYFPERGRTNSLLTGPDFLDVQQSAGVFDAIGYYYGAEMGLRVGDRAEFVPMGVIAPDALRVFGVAPVAGRTLNRDDEGQSALVSTAFAARHFGSADRAVNQSVWFESKPYRIVGVLPAGFDFPGKAQVWIAWTSRPEVMSRTAYNYRPVAKLAPGVTVDRANDRLAAISARLANQFPDSNTGKVLRAVPLRDRLVANVKTTLLLLQGAVGLLLLIGCANVTNLMLARATARSRETAVRTALGASRRRIVQELLLEGTVLATAAAALGVVIALFATRAMVANASHGLLPRVNEVGIDFRVLLFAFGVSFVACIGSALTPALQAWRIDVHEVLKVAGSRGVVGTGTSRLRSALVASQVALSVVLVVGATLLFRSFLSLASAELGFRTDGVLVMYAHDPARTKNEYLRVVQSQPALLQRLEEIVGVVSVGAAMGMPTGQYGVNGSYAVEGVSDFDRGMQLPWANMTLASPGYFSTVGIPLKRGRDFTITDQYSTEPVVIVSDAVVRQSFADRDPIGQRIRCGFDQESYTTWATIVGVVGDVRQDSPADPPSPGIYMPLAQHPFRANEYQVVLRTSLPPGTLTEAVQQAARQLNPALATKVTTLREMVGDSIATPRFRMILAVLFGSVALLLAVMGVYAVMSYVTVQRIPEFGLRAAMGASPASILRLVLGRAARLGVIGIVAGVLLALAASRVLQTMVFGVTSTDAVTYVLVLCGTLAAVMLAAAVPALRAARVDPMAALRDE